MQDGIVYYFLMAFIRRLPVLLLAVGGIAFAFIRWKRHPRVSLITVIALVILLVDWLVFILLLYWLPDIFRSMHTTPYAERWLYSIIYFCEDFVTAIMVVLLTAAAFMGRNQNTNPNIEPA